MLSKTRAEFVDDFTENLLKVVAVAVILWVIALAFVLLPVLASKLPIEIWAVIGCFCVCAFIALVITVYQRLRLNFKSE